MIEKRYNVSSPTILVLDGNSCLTERRLYAETERPTDCICYWAFE